MYVLISYCPNINTVIKGNVIQPYVKIKIRGHLVDESEYVTEVVPKVNDFLFKKYIIISYLAVHMIHQSIPSKSLFCKALIFFFCSSF